MTLPSNEVMFDRDVTSIVRVSPQMEVVADLTGIAGTLRDLEAVNTTPWNGPTGAAVYFFLAEPFDLHAFGPLDPFAGSTNNPRCHFSDDATYPANGDWLNWEDGTSVDLFGFGQGTAHPVRTSQEIADDPSLIPQFHSSASGVVAVRFRISSSGTFHRYENFRLWGIPSDPTEYLAVWDETLDQPAADDLLDLGQIVQGGTGTVDFRIKNLHPSASVDDVTLSTPDGFGPNDPHQQIDFDDGGGFANPLNIGTLAADTISSVITLRRVVGGGETPASGLASLLIDGTWA